MNLYEIVPQGSKSHKEGWDWFEGLQPNSLEIAHQKGAKENGFCILVARQ